MAGTGKDGTGERSAAAAAVADRVSAIIEAAEQTARRLRREAEDRARERIAGADRAAHNRVKAAEEEAAEILAAARAEADELRQAAKQSIAEATDRGLAIIADAERTAELTRKEAMARAGELIRAAQQTASEIRQEGFHTVGNLRELGDSMHANAERLLRDVLLVHKRLVAQIERIGGEEPGYPETKQRGRPPSPAPDEDLDVPGFTAGG